MKRTYYINGFREGKSYFLSLGRFTFKELSALECGEIISKNGNQFWVEKTPV